MPRLVGRLLRMSATKVRAKEGEAGEVRVARLCRYPVRVGMGLSAGRARDTPLAFWLGVLVVWSEALWSYDAKIRYVHREIESRWGAVHLYASVVYELDPCCFIYMEVCIIS